LIWRFGALSPFGDAGVCSGFPASLKGDDGLRVLLPLFGQAVLVVEEVLALGRVRPRGCAEGAGGARGFHHTAACFAVGIDLNRNSCGVVFHGAEIGPAHGSGQCGVRASRCWTLAVLAEGARLGPDPSSGFGVRRGLTRRVEGRGGFDPFSLQNFLQERCPEAPPLAGLGGAQRLLAFTPEGPRVGAIGSRPSSRGVGCPLLGRVCVVRRRTGCRG